MKLGKGWPTANKKHLMYKYPAPLLLTWENSWMGVEHSFLEFSLRIKLQKPEWIPGSKEIVTGDN